MLGTYIYPMHHMFMWTIDLLVQSQTTTRCRVGDSTATVAMAAALPDDLWMQILRIGVRSPEPTLSYRDLCSLSIASRRLRRLSADDSLWSLLLSSDFPPLHPPHRSIPTDSRPKLLYRLRFKEGCNRKRAAHLRAVLRKESQVAEHTMKLKSVEGALALEAEKSKAIAVELSNLLKVREASVALNVWQPQLIRERQKSTVEQCAVPVESRIRTLNMDLRVSKMQVSVLRKSYDDVRRRLDASKQELESIKYHPLQDYQVRESSGKRKKLKRSTTESKGSGKKASCGEPLESSADVYN